MRLFPAALALLLLVAPAFAQVRVVTTVTIFCDTPVPADTKATYDWYGDPELTLTPVGNGSSANPSGPDGTYDGVVVATIGGVKTPTAFSVTVGDSPAPPQPVETLRSLVTESEAKLIAEYFRDFASKVSLVKSTEQFWLAYNATFPVKGNERLDNALKVRLDAALLKPLEMSKGLLVIAAEFDSSPVPPKPEPPQPEPPVITQGKRLIVISHESEINNPDFGSLTVNLRKPGGTAASYIKQNGHELQILDDELIQEMPKLNALLGSQLSELPVLFIIDLKTNALLFKQVLPKGTTADNIIERIRENGG